MATKNRPTTCAAYAATSPAYMASRPASVTCKRLPAHKGECRVTLHEARPVVAKKPAKSAKIAKSANIDVVEILAKIASGDMTPSEALSLVAKASSRKPAPRKVRVTKPVAPSTKPVVWGCNVVTKTGTRGKVVRVTNDTAEIMLADKSRKTFAIASLTRI